MTEVARRGSGKVAARTAGRQARAAFLERARQQAEIVERQTAAWHAAQAVVEEAEARVREAEQAAEAARAERDTRQGDAVVALRSVGMRDAEIAATCSTSPAEVRRVAKVARDLAEQEKNGQAVSGD